jgi:hypothetical protein
MRNRAVAKIAMRATKTTRTLCFNRTRSSPISLGRPRRGEMTSIESHQSEENRQFWQMRHFFTCSSSGTHESTDYAMRLRQHTTTDNWGRVTCAKACVWYDRVRYVSLEVPERHIHRCFGSSARALAYGRAAVRGRALLSRYSDRTPRATIERQ